MQVRMTVEDRCRPVEFGFVLVENRLGKHDHAMTGIIGDDFLAQLLVRRIQIAEISAAMQDDDMILRNGQAIREIQYAVTRLDMDADDP